MLILPKEISNLGQISRNGISIHRYISYSPIKIVMYIKKEAQMLAHPLFLPESHHISTLGFQPAEATGTCLELRTPTGLKAFREE